MWEYVWGFTDQERAEKVAEALTQQNKGGRQAIGCKPRRFRARAHQGRYLLEAMPL